MQKYALFAKPPNFSPTFFSIPAFFASFGGIGQRQESAQTIKKGNFHKQETPPSCKAEIGFKIEYGNSYLRKEPPSIKKRQGRELLSESKEHIKTLLPAPAGCPSFHKDFHSSDSSATLRALPQRQYRPDWQLKPMQHPSRHQMPRSSLRRKSCLMESASMAGKPQKTLTRGAA